MYGRGPGLFYERNYGCRRTSKKLLNWSVGLGLQEVLLPPRSRVRNTFWCAMSWQTLPHRFR